MPQDKKTATPSPLPDAMVPDHKPRIAVGALLFEGNTLSPLVNTEADFRNKYFATGPALLAMLRPGGVEMSGAIRVLEAAGADIAPLFATHGGAGGRVSAEAWAELKGRLLAALRGAGRLDGLYLALHGAMVCEDTDDAEGDLLAEVRAIVGPEVPVAVSCDLHAHVTPAMLAHADILLAYQTYPHDDAMETGGRATRLLLRTVFGEIHPVVRACRAPLLVAPPACRTAGEGPMAHFNRWARQHEGRGDALVISYLPTQPWLDLPEVGFTAVVVTDANPAAAERLAFQLAEAAWKRREDFDVAVLAPEEAIRRGLELPQGPAVLADVADCTGGGATGDSAVVLRALLDHAPEAPACMLVVDPEVVQAARDAGEGARLHARVGNKRDPRYGEPVPVEARVQRLFDGRFTYRGGILAGGEASMGPSALLQAGGVQLVVSSQASYEYADEQFRAAGVDPWACRFVVVKNPMNYQSAYAAAPARWVLDTPGPTTCNLAAVPWQRITRPRYPVDTGFQPEFTPLAGRR